MLTSFQQFSIMPFIYIQNNISIPDFIFLFQLELLEAGQTPNSQLRILPGSIADSTLPINEVILFSYSRYSKFHLPVPYPYINFHIFFQSEVLEGDQADL